MTALARTIATIVSPSDAWACLMHAVLGSIMENPVLENFTNRLQDRSEGELVSFRYPSSSTSLASYQSKPGLRIAQVESKGLDQSAGLSVFIYHEGILFKGLHFPTPVDAMPCMKGRVLGL